MRVEVDLSLLLALYFLGFFSGWLTREGMEAVDKLRNHYRKRRG